ncbi:MAG: hypothetical protein H5U40_06850, partial [Polyangiaceae bacterium]|nr:hypothetical protein [Polyangiaceae bacterium]
MQPFGSLDSAARHDRPPTPQRLRPHVAHATYREAALDLTTGAASIYAFGLATSVAILDVESLAAALGLVVAPLAFAVFYAPSLWVLLALFDRPVAAGDVIRAAARGVWTMGALLAGLAPAA